MAGDVGALRRDCPFDLVLKLSDTCPLFSPTQPSLGHVRSPIDPIVG